MGTCMDVHDTHTVYKCFRHQSADFIIVYGAKFTILSLHLLLLLYLQCTNTQYILG